MKNVKWTKSIVIFVLCSIKLISNICKMLCWSRTISLNESNVCYIYFNLCFLHSKINAISSSSRSPICGFQQVSSTLTECISAWPLSACSPVKIYMKTNTDCAMYTCFGIIWTSRNIHIMYHIFSSKAPQDIQYTQWLFAFCICFHKPIWL